MKVSDLLLTMLQAAMKARDVARIIRSEPALLDLLVEEKTGAEKNKRFVRDFKTLADVLIQQMVSHDIENQFPEMAGSIAGEESNQFTNTLGETKTIRLCPTQEQTKMLLQDLLDDNDTAASVLSQVVHRKAAAVPSVEGLDSMTTDIPSTDVGIWIDPIDSTAQYIRGLVGKLDENCVTKGGLQCVAVLIGAFQKSSGLPIIGVAVQPFWELDPASQQWSDHTTWGVCYKDIHQASVVKNTRSPAASSLPVIVMSTSESEAVKQTLSENFRLQFASGAGYKLLCTAQRRVDAYVLSKSSIYVWDCCAPHAILRALGGGLVRFHDAVASARDGREKGVDGLSGERLKEVEVSYSSPSDSHSVKTRIDGVIAYSSQGVLDKIMKSLVQ